MLNPAVLRERNFIPVEKPGRLHKFKLPILLTVAHIPFGILLYNASSLAMLHPFVVFLIGMRRALKPDEKLERVAQIVIYMIGVEVLWRMARLPIFWESGKYAAAALMIVALAKRNCWKIPPLPLFYFLCLLPSSFLTLFNNEFLLARNKLSFNMSGPFLLFAACWFCSNLKLNTEELKTLFFTLIVPLTSVAFTTLFFTLTTANISFNTESNHATSGDYGPNQVSAMLGLGAFLCISCYLLFKNSLADKIYLGFFTVFLTAQSVMTFSRGGIYNAVGAALAVVLVQMRNPGQSLKRMLPVIGLSIIFLMLVFPYLNDFTGGNLQTRFEETDPTNRGKIVEADLQIFLANPILGVGVGESFFEYAKYMDGGTASHTEFSRLISEHGLFGIFALFCLSLMFIHNFIRQTTITGKAMVAGLVIWSCMFMLNAGMRLAAPSFILGLICLTITRPPVRKNGFPAPHRRSGAKRI